MAWGVDKVAKKLYLLLKERAIELNEASVKATEPTKVARYETVALALSMFADVIKDVTDIDTET